jgi:hypothetical protein
MDIEALVTIVNKNITRSTTFATISNSPSQTISFTYLPIVGEIPEISIKTIVKENNFDQTSIQKVNTIQICNCSSVDKNAKCLSLVQQTFNPNVDFLKCECSDPYTGDFCSELKDFCLALPCNAGQTCNTLVPSFQASSTNKYRCCNSETIYNPKTGTCDKSKIKLRILSEWFYF